MSNVLPTRETLKFWFEYNKQTNNKFISLLVFKAWNCIWLVDSHCGTLSQFISYIIDSAQEFSSAVRDCIVNYWILHFCHSTVPPVISTRLGSAGFSWCGYTIFSMVEFSTKNYWQFTSIQWQGSQIILVNGNEGG